MNTLLPPAQTTARAALAAQIGALTHVTDRLEQLAIVVPVYHDSVQREISGLHSIIDALNTLYDLQGSIDRIVTDEMASLDRRLRVNQQSAQKHHNGNIAACERADKLRAALSELLDAPDLNLGNLEDETISAMNAAKRLLYPDVS